MIVLSFLLIFSGLCVIVAGVFMFTLHVTQTGKWPGFSPRQWNPRAKRCILVTGCGLLLLCGGLLAGYGI